MSSTRGGSGGSICPTEDIAYDDAATRYSGENQTDDGLGLEENGQEYVDVDLVRCFVFNNN